MFFSGKTKLIETGFFNGFTDYHCHILPGVDDGIKTMEEALETLYYFDSLGIRKVVFTPHVAKDLANRPEAEQAFGSLTGQYGGAMKLSLGAEYMLDSGFCKLMEEGLRPLKGNRVLVETSCRFPSNKLYVYLYDLYGAGYIPVIAHPERYTYMDAAHYCKLKNSEYLFQLNLLSLSGYYGTQVMKNAEYLLEQGMYDMAGTDLHNLEIFKKWTERSKVTKKQQQYLSVIRGC